MQYRFARARISRIKIEQSKKQKDWLEKKRERLLETFTVEELISLGFYDTKPPSKTAFGVDVYNSSMDKLSTDRQSVSRENYINISVVLPPNCNPPWGLKNLNPHFDKARNSYCWRYQINGTAMIYCVYDLLTRILDFPTWDTTDAIPLYWAIGDSRSVEKAKQIIPLINSRNFRLKIPSVCFNGTADQLIAATKDYLEKNIPLGATVQMSQKAVFAYLRHQYTPYDYLWQTNKLERDKAKGLCNNLVDKYVKESKLNLAGLDEL